MKLRLATLALFAALAAPAAVAQCAMCYTSAAAASNQSQKAMSKAVIVLLVPPVTFMVTLVGIAVRYRNRQDSDAPSNADSH